VLVRERYNVVEYDGQTFVEGLPDRVLRMLVAPTVDQHDKEVIDDIRIYDRPPFITRLGSVQ
jgi:hypothetical protein